MNWSILYRGPLSSCNYDCSYCPFAKNKNSRKELEDDASKLARFVDWVEHRTEDTIGILFTPWGEGLVRKHYQQAIQRLSHMPQVSKVSIQTNLSCTLSWTDQCDKTKVALWTTYHPGQVSRMNFLHQCRTLDEKGVRYSVGMVGFKEAFEEIEALRKELPSHVYLWINAYKKENGYYSEQDVARLLEVDPYVEHNMQYHESLGKSCKAGETVFSVDGDGNMTRCHFVKTQLGNIYDPDFEKALLPRSCTNTTCGCHIGYIHLEELDLYKLYGQGLLPRIPANRI